MEMGDVIGHLVNVLRGLSREASPKAVERYGMKPAGKRADIGAKCLPTATDPVNEDDSRICAVTRFDETGGNPVDVSPCLAEGNLRQMGPDAFVAFAAHEYLPHLRFSTRTAPSIHADSNANHAASMKRSIT